MSFAIKLCTRNVTKPSVYASVVLMKPVVQDSTKNCLCTSIQRAITTVQKPASSFRKPRSKKDEEKDIANSPHFQTLVEDTHHEDEKRAHATLDLVPGKGPPPEPPTYCCMSGCANCVYLTYAQELLDYYKDGGEKAKQAIKEQVKDPNLQMFLLMEMNLL
ncbi:oxidoreductase-like domain-containing protein 1 [Lingula anatina]|uniref:Oxidoreductase-like domain-containing protein 1 n=1 Tax=Lingula anatina TaxID=7574 RepID=A0A1S3HLW6_LINAN|nr:oxidoreductase-like domain-containing protein 1 [Lingula anatina]|eukprot:XP_013387017.1 oxidoreductase-like domain-containing protein 1 [Lingula anatina]